jgi:D-inositol-3-phosphate glycosyltransferase
MYRLALLSVHGCPVARLGEKDTGGMNVYVLQVARELGRRGHQADVFTRWHDPNDPQVIDIGDNARVIHLKAGPYFETKRSLHRHIPEFLDSLYRFQRSEETSYDLIHSHYWLSGAAGMRLSDEWDVPHYTTFHTLARTKMQARPGEKESRLRIATETSVMTSVDAIVVSTEQEREDLSRLYDVPSSKTRVISAGVDLELFKPIDKADARSSLGLTEENIVLSVGRLEPLKGLDVLIGAMSRLESLDDTRLVIVGGQPGHDRELERLKSIARTLGLSDKVTFTGTMDQTDLPAYYSAADVFVMPSHYESFGLAALEAMACGTPVIASRVGGLKAFVKDGRVGYLIPWHCPEPYAQRLDVLLANPALREGMGRAARAEAETMGWSHVASDMLDLYSDAGVAGTAATRVAGA